LSLFLLFPKIVRMKTDPLYDEISQRLRAMNEQELAEEVHSARAALMQLALKHMHEPNYEDVETLTAELRLLEAELALNLKVRDATVKTEMAREMQRTGRAVTPQTEEVLHSVVHSMFESEIDRLQSQRAMVCEKLAEWP
jgi:hypothetical protein